MLSVDAMGDAIQSISSMLKNVGAALMENMKAEQEMRLVQSLDTPDRKDFARKQMALRMADAEEQTALRIAENRAKRRRLELGGQEQDEEEMD